MGGAWVYSMSYADDMVLRVPTVTALRTLLEVCGEYALPHDIVYNTTKQYVCWSGKSNLRRYSTRVRLGNEELSFVKEFRYLGHVMTADRRDDKDIKKQFRRQTTLGNMPARKFSFTPTKAKNQLLKSYCYLFFNVLFDIILTRTLFENLLSVIVTHSNDLLMSPDTPAREWHLR